MVNLFFSEVTLTRYRLRNNGVLFLYRVYLGGWLQYKDHCKHTNVVPIIEKKVIKINWKRTFSWGKFKESSNTGCIGYLVIVFHSENQLILCWYEDNMVIYHCILGTCTWFYLSDMLLQLICHLCDFHKTHVLLEGFRYGIVRVV